MSIEDLEKFGIDGPKVGKLVILLSSKWCRSCKSLFRLLETFRDKGFINLKEIDIGENSKLTRQFNINAIPALIFFKDAKLLNKNLEINGELLVNNGVMIGSFNESILKEIIKQM